MPQWLLPLRRCSGRSISQWLLPLRRRTGATTRERRRQQGQNMVMEARYRHWKNQGSGPGPVFFTTTVLDFVPIFSSSQFAADMTRLLISAHAKHNVRLSAFVIMPEHIHFLRSLPAAITASDFGRRLTSFSARHVVSRLSPRETAMFEQQRGLNGRVFWQEL